MINIMKYVTYKNHYVVCVLEQDMRTFYYLDDKTDSEITDPEAISDLDRLTTELLAHAQEDMAECLWERANLSD